MEENVYFCTIKLTSARMSYPIGDFNCKLDSKGRLVLPSDFREQMGEQAEEGFVLRPSLFEGSQFLDLYTHKEWDEEQQKLRAKIDIYDEEGIDVLRILNEGVRFVKLDASGRLQIPKELKELGGLTKEVVIQALANKMEIWDKNLRELHKKSVSTADKKKALEYLKSIK